MEYTHMHKLRNGEPRETGGSKIPSHPSSKQQPRTMKERRLSKAEDSTTEYKSKGKTQKSKSMKKERR